MRCREFFMKDAYSFDLTDQEAKTHTTKCFTPISELLID